MEEGAGRQVWGMETEERNWREEQEEENKFNSENDFKNKKYRKIQDQCNTILNTRINI